MNTKEKELFLELCKFNNVRAEVLKDLLPQYATAGVLGSLFINRMSGVAYDVLRSNGLLGTIDREFRNSLYNSYLQNTQKNESFFKCVQMLNDILKEHSGKYAMLKGAVLCRLYPTGYRTSNDIDLLVMPESITEIGNTLIKAGFRQGSIKNGEFIPATRREIIESKMMRGETVPYILTVNLPFMKFLEVDINFSLDYKNSDANGISKMLSRTNCINVKGLEITTLDKYDFLLHLCCHLYKECTTLPWIVMKRDMTLYKFLDIYLLLDLFTEDDAKRIFERAVELGIEDICACVILWTKKLLGVSNKAAVKLSKAQLSENRGILDTVIAPSEHKTYIYKQHDVKKRFFARTRINLLKEK